MNHYSFILLSSSIVVFALAGGDISGEIFGFIDANYDRYTDLLVRRGKNNLTVYMASKEEPTFAEAPSFSIVWKWSDELIVNVGVGDFNGDSWPDLLVTSVLENSKPLSFNVAICWNDGGSRFKECNRSSNWNGLKEQPLILNCDDDQISDFFVVNSNNSNVCFLGKESGVFLEKPEFTESKLRYPNGYHGFADITGDLNADVILMTSSNNSNNLNNLTFEIWERTADGSSSKWSRRKINIPPPIQPSLLPSSENSKKIGHVIFDDFNRDGQIDILLPYYEAQTLHLALGYMIASDEGDKWSWETIDVPLNSTQGSPMFSVDLTSKDYYSPFVMRSGDYTQNGFPDLLVVLNEANSESKTGVRRAYFIENVPCFQAGYKCTYGRQFRMSWQPVAPCKGDFHVQTAAFFDLNEDGTLDVLFECVNDEDAASAKFLSKIQFTASLYSGDTTFLKVQAYTATCSRCNNGKEGTGISLPGASFSYKMIDTEGNQMWSSYSQQSSTSYRSLLLPYALFGLGRSPNFIDKLRLGIPAFPPANQTWQQIVPNSRMYVIPFPANSPGHWVGRLYVTPSRLILMSVAALGGVCLLIAIAIIILHYIEMRADRKEREIQKKHFHFDAM